MSRPRTARRLTHGLAIRTWQRSVLAGLRASCRYLPPRFGDG